MILLTLALAAQIQAASGAAAKTEPPNGATIFAQQCSIPYCHGAAGTASRAPALAGRNFSRGQLREVISKGRARFGMPAFGSKLSASELDSVISYILALPAPASGPTETTTGPPPIKLSPEQITGRDLFFDSERLPSCGTCHAVNGSGGTIAAPITSANLTVEKLRNITATGVVTVRVSGESPFPALRESSLAGTVRVADLSAPLPVVRTFRDGEVSLSESGAWHHADIVNKYSPAELQSIITWLKAVLAHQS